MHELTNRRERLGQVVLDEVLDGFDVVVGGPLDLLDLGGVGVLFWIDAIILLVLVPWALANGELVDLLHEPKNVGDWFNLLFTAVLGGVRFYSQVLVLKFHPASSLAVANLAFQAINIYLSLALFGWPKNVLAAPHPDSSKVQVIGGTLITLGGFGFRNFDEDDRTALAKARCGWGDGNGGANAIVPIEMTQEYVVCHTARKEYAGSQFLSIALNADWREPLDATGAFARFKEGGALRASIIEKGGSVAADGAVAFPKVGTVDGPLVEEVAALVEYALKPGADRLDVLVASEASHAENAAAAAQLLKCACAAISSNEDPAALVFVEPPSSTKSRRLAATDAPTASSSTEYYSLEEIRNYQICLWTAIALISVLLSAVLFLACMRPEYDSLLYATFQANVGDHFGKEN